MEANPPPVWMVAGLAAAAAVLAVTVVGSADHWTDDGTTEYCETTDDFAPPHRSWAFARIRSTGYIEGSLDALGVDETTHETVDQYYWGSTPELLEDKEGQGRFARDIHVVSHPLTVQYPAVTNNPTFLGGHLPQDTPVTELELRAVGYNTDQTRTFTGATKIEMVFTGRILVYEPESYSCITNDQGTETFTGRRVVLEGFGTHTRADETLADQDTYGTGLGVRINPAPDYDRSLD